MLASLPEEQRPVADQALRGGLASVRQAVGADHPLVALAEELLPRLRVAEWRDRAEAAERDLDTISLRDLRSVVASSEAAGRDDEARALAARLKEGLERRSTAERDRWLTELSGSLDDGRVVRALRVSSRPPEPATRLPADMATRLRDAAAAALAPDVTAERWLAVLDAVITSPVRRTVQPAGLPSEAGDDVVQTARRAAAHVPALARLLGMAMPPPPPSVPPRPSRRPAQGARPRRPAPSAEPSLTPPPAGDAEIPIGMSVPEAAAEPAFVPPTSQEPPEVPEGPAASPVPEVPETEQADEAEEAEGQSAAESTSSTR